MVQGFLQKLLFILLHDLLKSPIEYLILGEPQRWLLVPCQIECSLPSLAARIHLHFAFEFSLLLYLPLLLLAIEALLFQIGHVGIDFRDTLPNMHRKTCFLVHVLQLTQSPNLLFHGDLPLQRIHRRLYLDFLLQLRFFASTANRWPDSAWTFGYFQLFSSSLLMCSGAAPTGALSHVFWSWICVHIYLME